MNCGHCGGECMDDGCVCQVHIYEISLAGQDIFGVVIRPDTIVKVTDHSIIFTVKPPDVLVLNEPCNCCDCEFCCDCGKYNESFESGIMFIEEAHEMTPDDIINISQKITPRGDT